MPLQFALVKTDEGTEVVTVFVPGHKPMVALDTHPNWDAIKKGVLEGDEKVIELFDVAATAATKFKALSDRVSVANGRIYLDGEEVKNALTDKVVAFIREGQPFQPLVNFFEKVLSNPQEHSREQLYRWLDTHKFTITDNGDIVGYKGVASNDKNGFVSISRGKAIVNGEVHEGAIPNPIGGVITMPRGEVEHSPGRGCATGLHVGTYAYAKDFSRSGVLEVHVNPRDVVSVPTDSGDAKMRVCRYVVVKAIKKPYETSLRTPAKGETFAWGDGEDTPAPRPVRLPRPVPGSERKVTPGQKVKKGDKFESTDKRYADKVFTVRRAFVDGVEGSWDGSNRFVWIDLGRLNSYRYKPVA